MHNWNGGNGWSGGWMFLAMVIPVVVLVSCGVAIALWAGRRPPRASTTGRNEALEILEARFARGELDEEEFRSRTAVLTEVVPTNDVGRRSGGR